MRLPSKDVARRIKERLEWMFDIEPGLRLTEHISRTEVVGEFDIYDMSPEGIDRMLKGEMNGYRDEIEEMRFDLYPLSVPYATITEDDLGDD